MDTNTAGKFKPKPPPKPSFDGKLSINKPEQGKQLLQSKKLNKTSVQQKIQASDNPLRDQKPPLLPKPHCLNKPKLLSPGQSQNVIASTTSRIPSPALSPVSNKVLHSTNTFDVSNLDKSSSNESEIYDQMKTEITESVEEYSVQSFISEGFVKSFDEEESDLAKPLESFVGTDLTVAENQSMFENCNEMNSFYCCDKFGSKETDFLKESSEIIIDVNISDVSNLNSASQNNVYNNGMEIRPPYKENEIVADDICSTSSSDHCDKDTSSLQPEEISLKGDLDGVESDLKTLSFIDQTPSGDLDSQSSDSSCGSFTVLSSDCLPEHDGSISNQVSINSSNLRNQSFLHSLNCINNSCEINSSDIPGSTEVKKDYSHSQYSVENVMASVIETSTPVATGDYGLRSLHMKSGSFTDRRFQSEENFSSNSWTEDDVSREKSNSIDSDSMDGSVSVRRRLSTWFGSFGKGSKQKDKRESCLFYCDETDSVEADFNVEDMKQSENSNDQLMKLPSSSIISDGGNNRGSVSVSEESSEMDQQSVCNNDLLPENKRERKAFYVARELMTSEKVFIDVLKLLCIDFKNYIKNYSKDKITVSSIQNYGKENKSSVIPEDEFDKIISSLPQLLGLSEDLLQDLESRISSWSQLPKISDVIVKKGPFLKLFSLYIQNFESQCNFLDECCHKYPRFAKAVKSFEMSERCKKLSVKHYMLKPVQRIPQYRLLLDDYLAHLDEGSHDYDDTRVALDIVSDVANHADKSIKNGDHLCKLLQLQSQLGNYEIIRPWRRFIKEGELLKLSRKENQLRYFILLNDCLLYTSFYGSMTGLKVKHELSLSGMKVTVPLVEDCNTEFSIITSTRSFILRARSEAECNEWVTALQNAVKENNNRQLTFVNMKFVAKNAAAETIKLGKEAPIWIQDKRVTMCQACTAVFTVTFRRHHCRACGKVVCGSCSENKAPLQYMKFQTARVCDECHNYLLKEFEDPGSNMFDIIKTELCLTDYDAITNAIEHIRSSFKKQAGSIKKIRKYVPSRLKEVTANDSGSQLSGWLYRRGKRSWKRLWFVLKEQVLYVYKASEDIVAVESIPILGYKIESVKEGAYDDTDLQHIFQLSHANQDPLVFGIESQHSANRWISAFEEAIVLK